MGNTFFKVEDCSFLWLELRYNKNSRCERSLNIKKTGTAHLGSCKCRSMEQFWVQIRIQRIKFFGVHQVRSRGVEFRRILSAYVINYTWCLLNFVYLFSKIQRENNVKFTHLTNHKVFKLVWESEVLVHYEEVVSWGLRIFSSFDSKEQKCWLEFTYQYRQKIHYSKKLREQKVVFWIRHFRVLIISWSKNFFPRDWKIMLPSGRHMAYINLTLISSI